MVDVETGWSFKYFSLCDDKKERASCCVLACEFANDKCVAVKNALVLGSLAFFYWVMGKKLV